MREIKMQPVREGALHNPDEKHELHIVGSNMTNVIRLTNEELATLREQMAAYRPEVHNGRYGAGDYHCDACGGSFPDQDARRAHRPGGACSGRPRNADYGACAYKEGRCSGRCAETWCEIRDGAPSDPLQSS